MQEEIRRMARNAPFVPFVIHLNDSRAVRVPHPDYIFVGHGPFVIVENDQGVTDYLQTQNISGMTVEASAAPQAESKLGARP